MNYCLINLTDTAESDRGRDGHQTELMSQTTSISLPVFDFARCVSDQQVRSKQKQVSKSRQLLNSKQITKEEHYLSLVVRAHIQITEYCLHSYFVIQLLVRCSVVS